MKTKTKPTKPQVCIDAELLQKIKKMQSALNKALNESGIFGDARIKLEEELMNKRNLELSELMRIDVENHETKGVYNTMSYLCVYLGVLIKLMTTPFYCGGVCLGHVHNFMMYLEKEQICKIITLIHAYSYGTLYFHDNTMYHGKFYTLFGEYGTITELRNPRSGNTVYQYQVDVYGLAQSQKL